MFAARQKKPDKLDIIMNRFYWFTILCFLTISCTKTVEVKQDEIGLVFSNWNGKSYATYYEAGIYNIPFYKGFTAAKIIEKTQMIKIVKEVNKDTLEINIKVSFKPIPQKNFDLYDTLGLDYDKTFVQPLLTIQASNLREFKGTNIELVQRLRDEIENDKVFKRYLKLTTFEIMKKW
jgi:hypothetical protein